MGNLAYKGVMSTGKNGGGPSALTHKIQCTKSYVGGIIIGVVGDQFDTQPITNDHDSQRQIVAGASKTFFEGNAAARINDPLQDGDSIAQGNAKTTVE
jgi:uncharacterized Zn-binding protein involved in type VI secretion